MIKAIPMEDWLRGCVYHDGRHGYVTLPCDEVLRVADFIERLKADRKTEPQTEEWYNWRDEQEYNDRWGE